MCVRWFIFLQWRATDMLVWHSADTTRKEKCLLVILVDFVKHQFHNIDEASNQLRNYTTIWVVSFFSTVDFIWHKTEMEF
jgi:hypothetical protein